MRVVRQARGQVKKLLGRGGVALCNECVRLCCDILDAELEHLAVTGAARVVLAVLLLASHARADNVYAGMHHGFVRFDGKQAKQLFKSPRFVLHVEPAGADRFWLGSTLSVHRLNQGKLDEKLLDPPLFLRTSAAGVPWLGNQKEVAWFDGTWHSLRDPPRRARAVQDQSRDRRNQGSMSILVGGRLLYTTGTSWTTFAGPDPDSKFCKLATRGSLYLACWENIYRLDQNAWASVAKLDKVTAEELHVAADGTIYVVAGEQVHVRRGTVSLDLAIPRWKLNGFTVDARGHMWFAHGDGLTVLDAKGTKLKLPRALVTRGEVHSIYVEGVGPAF